MSWLAEAWAVVVASDPGLLRLRLGLRAVVAVGVAAFLLQLLGPTLGIPSIVAMLLGGMVGLNGAFATSSRDRRDAALTVLGMPVAAAVTVSAATLLDGHRLAMLAGFVVVMVVAAFVRRFGPRWFNYGMIGWLAYFFTTFIGFVPSQIGDVLAIVAVAAGCVLLSAWLIPDRPEALLRASLRAFDLRLDRVLRLVDAGLTGAVAAADLERRLHGATFRMLEAALIVDGHLGHAETVNEQQSAVVRHNLLDAELAAEELARASVRLVTCTPVGAPERDAARRVITALLAREHLEALRLARELPDDVEALRSVAATVPALVEGLQQRHVDVPAHVGSYQPAVPLFLGNLPGVMPSAVRAIGDRTSRWSRLSQNTRLCIQVAVATSITVAAGDALSGRRYYWAVLACFLALTGTFTTGEIVVKGGSRVVGTVLGLIVATVVVHVTGQNTLAIVGVMLVCVFVGLYFFRVSYALMAFAITTVMGELYNVLHEFSADLLLLRLAETALGAAIGIAVAFLVLPIRTGDALAAAKGGFVAAVCDLLTAARHRLAGHPPTTDLFLSARRVDAALHQLALVARPAGGATLLGLRSRRSMRRLGRWSQVAFLARATAVSVAESSYDGGGHHRDRACCLATELDEAVQQLRS